MKTAKKQSSQEVIDGVLMNGGVIYVDGVQVYVDNPNDFETISSPTGFWLKSAMGYFVYLKAKSRVIAQEVTNKLFGKGRYTVNSKV